MTIVRSLLALVLVSALAAAVRAPQAQLPGPAVAVSDSITFHEDGQVHKWYYRIEPRADGGESQMHVVDDRGREFVLPTHVVSLLGTVAADPGFGQFTFFVERGMGVRLVALLALASLCFFAALSLRYRKRYLVEQERRLALHESRKRLNEGREEERLRLAQELHDGPVQDLHILRMRLGVAPPPHRDETGAFAQAGTADYTAEVQRIIREIRGISETLRPPALAPFGLAAALRSFAKRYEEAHPHIAVRLELDEDDQLLPQQVRLALFRIAQESAHNAAKHARPDTVLIRLRVAPEQVTLEVRDDGDGFGVPDDLGAFAAGGHYGLLGMAERAEFIGARLRVESQRGEFTCVEVVADRSASEWQTPFMRSKT